VGSDGDVESYSISVPYSEGKKRFTLEVDELASLMSASWERMPVRPTKERIVSIPAECYMF